MYFSSDNSIDFKTRFNESKDE